eukprot:scaffold1032_cov223-Pinguiococcus_pyrenoidosus.AAC.3
MELPWWSCVSRIRKKLPTMCISLSFAFVRFRSQRTYATRRSNAFVPLHPPREAGRCLLLLPGSAFPPFFSTSFQRLFQTNAEGRFPFPVSRFPFVLLALPVPLSLRLPSWHVHAKPQRHSGVASGDPLPLLALHQLLEEGDLVVVFTAEVHRALLRRLQVPCLGPVHHSRHAVEAEDREVQRLCCRAGSQRELETVGEDRVQDVHRNDFRHRGPHQDSIPKGIWGRPAEAHASRSELGIRPQAQHKIEEGEEHWPISMRPFNMSFSVSVGVSFSIGVGVDASSLVDRTFPDPVLQGIARTGVDAGDDLEKLQRAEAHLPRPDALVVHQAVEQANAALEELALHPSAA